MAAFNLNGNENVGTYVAIYITPDRRTEVTHARTSWSRMRGRRTAAEWRDERGSLVQYISDQFSHVIAFGQSRHVVTYVMCVEHHLPRTKVY